MSKTIHYFSMVFATFLFAGAFIAGKLGTSDFSPVVMTFLRIGIAFIILFPFMVFREKEKWKASKSQLILSFKLGLVGMTFYHLFFFNALRYTTASNASVINASMPVITAILALFVLKERISFKRIVFIITAFIGVILTITNWNLSILTQFELNIGDLLMLCGTLSWATYGVLIKKHGTGISAIKLTAYTFMMCLIILFPFAMFEILVNHALDVPLKGYYVIFYMALFPTVLGYTIQQNAIKTLGPSTAALFINLVPIFSIILSIIILKEAINPLTYISGLIIIMSVFLFTKVKN